MITAFDTFTEASGPSATISGTHLRTHGYGEIGDGGGALYGPAGDILVSKGENFIVNGNFRSNPSSPVTWTFDTIWTWQGAQMKRANTSGLPGHLVQIFQNTMPAGIV